MMIAFSPSFVEVNLPPGHRFPMGKYAALAQRLTGLGWTIKASPEATLTDLERVHTRDYLQTWFSGTLSPYEERALGFPQSEQMLQRSLHSIGGTLEAMMQALEHGYGIHLAGGTHHAFADRGEGFCVFNDLAIGSCRALAEQLASRIMIIDLDVHQGNGTAKIFEAEPRVFTLSIHGERNYPFRKERSDLDIGLPDGTTDNDYLMVLKEHVPKLFETFKPDLVFLQAGIDVLAHDRYGRMSLTQDGVVARDSFIYELCKDKLVPLVYTMGGGYQANIEVLVSAHAASLERLKKVFTSRS
jgi:acetoin utilization deacetylase AcuC-like enzyme